MLFSSLFLVTDTATTDVSPLSLHDALPISHRGRWPPSLALYAEYYSGSGDPHDDPGHGNHGPQSHRAVRGAPARALDRKSTRLNSSHRCISYAVFCLKKKTNKYALTQSQQY